MGFYSKILLMFCLVLFSCGKANPPQTINRQSKSSQADTTSILPSVNPVEEQFMHYWDQFSFADTSCINNSEITEQAFVNYIILFPEVSLDVVDRGIHQMLDVAIKSNASMYDYLTGLYEKYLSNPNSLYRQEDYYILVLKSMINNPKLDEIKKIRPRFQLEMAMKNRPGTIATDFSFELSTGGTMKLSQVQSDFIILFFNNPGCHDCARVKEILSKYKKRGVKVVAIYPDDDISFWRKTKYPEDWIDGHNSSINKNNYYDLKAMPTLYLLDNGKRVILKDSPVEVILAYLN